jgi:hypothetical protein
MISNRLRRSHVLAVSTQALDHFVDRLVLILYGTIAALSRGCRREMRQIAVAVA